MQKAFPSLVLLVALASLAFASACPTSTPPDGGTPGDSEPAVDGGAGSEVQDAGNDDAGAAHDDGDAGAPDDGLTDGGTLCSVHHCDGNVLVECDADGGETRTPCTEGQMCVDDDMGATCVVPDCQPSDVATCSSTFAVDSCQQGRWTTTRCQEGHTCVDGACVMPNDCGLTVYSDSFGAAPYAYPRETVTIDASGLFTESANIVWLVNDEVHDVDDESRESPFYDSRRLMLSMPPARRVVQARANGVECTVVVDPVFAPADMRFTLTWDTDVEEDYGADLDLQLAKETEDGFCVRAEPTLASHLATTCTNEQAGDVCTFNNCTSDRLTFPNDEGSLDWGTAGPAGDPTYVYDSRLTSMPENITLHQPEDGRYLVAVKMYDLRSQLPISEVRASVEVRVGGTLLTTVPSPVFDGASYWEVGIVTVASGEACFESLADDTTTCRTIGVNEAPPVPDAQLCASDNDEPNNQPGSAVVLDEGTYRFSACHIDVDYYFIPERPGANTVATVSSDGDIVHAFYETFTVSDSSFERVHTGPTLTTPFATPLEVRGDLTAGAAPVDYTITVEHVPLDRGVE